MYWLGVEAGTWSPPLSGEAARYWVLLGGPRSSGTGSNGDVVSVADARWRCLLSWRRCWQDFTACLGLLGRVIGTLHMEFLDDNVSDSESLRSLWACHNLRSLTLVSHDSELRAEDINAGLQHLRFAAITPLTSSHYICKSAYQGSQDCLILCLLLMCVRQAAGIFEHPAK